MSTPIAFAVPAQDLKQLSVCKAEPQALRDWLHHLPTANLGETSRQLYTVLTELNRVKLAPETRLELLELLRTQVYAVCRGLAKHFLNQPIVLPPKARNVAHLAQVLQSGLATGYTIVAAESQAARGLRKGGLSSSGAIHRAISDHTQVLLRNLLLCQPMPAGLWQTLHRLHDLAHRQQLDREAVMDTCNASDKPLSVNQVYCRALLIGAARPNQLCQQELRDIYQALGLWCQQVNLGPCPPGHEGLVLDPAGDSAPVYRQFSSSEESRLLAVDAGQLVTDLRILAEDESSEAATVNGASIPDNLLLHLAHAWGTPAERGFTRQEAGRELSICLGLSAVHHHLSEGQGFDELMGIEASAIVADEMESNRFMRGAKKSEHSNSTSSDPWSQPFQIQFSGAVADKLKTIDKDAEARTRQARADEERRRYPVSLLKTLNASPGGYGLAWSGEPPALLKAGELIGLREHNSPHWLVAVIRWLKPGASGAEFGVEVLSHSAQPWGGQAVRKTGDSGEFLRVLLLPEADGLPASLLTPRVGFRSRQKVILQQKGEQRQLRLARKLDATAAWCRFGFDSIGTGNSPGPVALDVHKDGFDALWKTL